jgi:hypothetical protein
VHVLYLDGCSNESTDEIFGFLVIRIASLQAYGMPILAETEPNRDQNQHMLGEIRPYADKKRRIGPS